MERIVHGLPMRPVRHLDHVSATPLTCLKRVLFLARNYELQGATVLLLGDHDLTSLALAQVVPGVAITVVDSDERILDYINVVAAQHGWTIRTLFADLRVALPRSVETSCDLVFTDPPYTPEGMRLFLARGLESLKPTSSARLLFCYGFSERHPGLGLKVQSVLHDLHLVAEAILPHFNRYRGAQAIASSAALYICRPTRRSLPAAQALKIDPRIYTQGKSAEETTMTVLSQGVVDTVKHLLAAQAPARVLLVGDGWPQTWRVQWRPFHSGDTCIPCLLTGKGHALLMRVLLQWTSSLTIMPISCVRSCSLPPNSSSSLQPTMWWTASSTRTRMTRCERSSTAVIS